MKDKIRKYVEYQFRFQKDEKTQEMIEEIIGNLHDRYDDLYQKYQDEEKSYLEAIKQMGEFSELIEPKEAIKPSWMDMSLVVSIILAIFGLIIIFFHLLTGIIVTLLSIALYAIASNHLYQLAHYAKVKEMDIDKHHLLISKIYKFMKTSFIFWAMSLTLIISSIPSKLLIGLSLYYTFGTLNPSDLESIVRISVTLSAIVFVLSSVLISLLFYNLYRRLNEKYIFLVGRPHQESYLKDASSLFMGSKHHHSIFSFKEHMTSIITLIVVLLLFFITSSSSLSLRVTVGFLEFEYEYINVFKLFSDHTFAKLFIFTSLISLATSMIPFIRNQKALMLNFTALSFALLSSVIVKIGMIGLYSDQSNQFVGINENYNISIALSIIVIIAFLIVSIVSMIQKNEHLKWVKKYIIELITLGYSFILFLISLTTGLYKDITVTNGVDRIYFYVPQLLDESLLVLIGFGVLIVSIMVSASSLIFKKNVKFLPYLVMFIIVIANFLIRSGISRIYTFSTYYDGVSSVYLIVYVLALFYMLMYTIYLILLRNTKKKQVKG